MSDTPRLDPVLLDAWKHHEDIAIHFNDLIMRVRTRALAILAAIIAASAVALKIAYEGKTEVPWGTITLVLLILLAFWVAIWVLDFLYYNRLLMGAVDAILKLEDNINGSEPIEIVMSHKIESSVRNNETTYLGRNTLKGPLLFYSIVTAVLAIGATGSTVMIVCARNAT